MFWESTMGFHQTQPAEPSVSVAYRAVFGCCIFFWRATPSCLSDTFQLLINRKKTDSLAQ